MLLLLIAGGVGALIDLTLHVLQLWPDLVPSAKTIRALTALSGLLLMSSCADAFNAGAFLMGLGVFSLAVFSAITGKDLD